MNLRQLRYISEVTRQGLNVSAAAESLHTSQPGVSKQIRQLEDELGVQIFERAGRQLTALTPAGSAILERANRTLVEADGIRRVADEFSDPQRGALHIATTHTQARYTLPDVIEEFVGSYPRVSLHIHQGTPNQIAELTLDSTADLCIATEGFEHFDDLSMMPCYQWNRAIFTPHGHPLCEENPLTLEAVARYPIVTYVFGFNEGSALDLAFRRHGISPEVALTATDADVIKTYVRRGLGVGIAARMSWDKQLDQDLCVLDAGHLFDPSTTRIGFRRGLFMRGYMYDFIRMAAPHLTRDVVDTVMQSRSRAAMDALFMDVDMPMR